MKYCLFSAPFFMILAVNLAIGKTTWANQEATQKETTVDREMDFVNRNTIIALVCGEVEMPKEVNVLSDILKNNGFRNVIIMGMPDNNSKTPEQKGARLCQVIKQAFQDVQKNGFLSKNARIIYVAMGDIGPAMAAAALQNPQSSYLIAIDAKIGAVDLHAIQGYARLVVGEPTALDNDKRLMPNRNVVMVMVETKDTGVPIYKRVISSKETIGFVLDRIFEYGLVGYGN